MLSRSMEELCHTYNGAGVLHEREIRTDGGNEDRIPLNRSRGEAVGICIHQRAAIEVQRGLPGPDQGRDFQHGKGGGVRHMRVKRCLGARLVQVHARMAGEGGRCRPAIARPHIALDIPHQQALCGDFRKPQDIGGHPTLINILRHRPHNPLVDG